MSALFYKKRWNICKKRLKCWEKKVNILMKPSIFGSKQQNFEKYHAYFKYPDSLECDNMFFDRLTRHLNDGSKREPSKYLTWERGNNTSPLCDFRGVTSQTWLYAVLWRQSITIQGRQPPASSYIDKNRHRTSLSAQAVFLWSRVSFQWSATPPAIKRLENSSYYWTYW